MKPISLFLLIATITNLACTHPQKNKISGSDSTQPTLVEQPIRNNEDSLKEISCLPISFEKWDTTILYKMDALNPNSPCLTAEISLERASGNPAKVQSMNTIILQSAIQPISSSPNANLQEWLTQLRNDYYALQTDYFQDTAEGDTPTWYNHAFEIKGKNYQGHPSTINYITDSYSYTGGAHGSYFTTLLNFDRSSGQIIKLSDVFQENSAKQLANRIRLFLGKQLNKKTTQEINEYGYFNIEDLSPTENFLLEKDSIVFLYNIYEIAPYALGQTRIAINYNDLKDILSAPWKKRMEQSQ